MEGEAPPGLVYVSDAEPGITRRARGRGFSFHDLSGRLIGPGRSGSGSCGWACPRPTGRSGSVRWRTATSRRRGSTRWGASSTATMPTGAPGGRRGQVRTARGIRGGAAAAAGEDPPGPGGQAGDLGFTLAALAMLIDRLNLRVGNASYTETSRTYGATTLLKKHLSLATARCACASAPRGASGSSHTLRDRRLSRILAGDPRPAGAAAVQLCRRRG